MITLEQEIQNEEEAPPFEVAPPQELIFDDGEPLETARHRNAMNLLIDSLRNSWKNRSDFYVGGNMFVYYTSAQLSSKPPLFRGPDFFLVLDTDGSTERKGWVVWEESGKYPDMIVEFLSLRTRKSDLGPKKDIYEKIFHTREYYVYDPFAPSMFTGWRLNGLHCYEEIPQEPNGWLFSETTNLYLGTWEGRYYDYAPWLRFFDREGNLVLTHTEEAQKIAEEERIKAEEVKKKLEEEQMKAKAAQKKLEDAEKRILQLEQELKKQNRI